MGYSNIKSNAARTRAIEWNQLRARLFRFQDSAQDERYFKAQIHEWLLKPQAERCTWTQLLFNMVHTRNTNPKVLKYCYYNERMKRVVLSLNFEKWADTIQANIKNALSNYYG